MEPNTEEKIKAAAARLFTTRGFAATRTRDIAEEAGINLALLNYYFRSKENLYRIIMAENFQVFFRGALQIFHNQQTGVEEKISQLVDYYIGRLLENPDIPSFVINELRSNPNALIQQLGMHDALKETKIFSQIRQYLEEKGSDMDPVHFILNLLGMTIFPFLAAPVFQAALGLEKEQFSQLLAQRKKLIPIWINSIINASSLKASKHTS